MSSRRGQPRHRWAAWGDPALRASRSVGAWSIRVAVLFLAAVAFGTIVATTAEALTIELRDVAPDRIERQRAAQSGGPPLPGTPDTTRLPQRLAERGLALGSPVFIRVFKAESELEVWMRSGERFELLAVYPICYWSGSIGPKLLEGDKQNPEGFYAVNRRLLHRSGRWPRSLNLGFPNLLDRAHARTGSYILVHGGCSSIGCFAMTDPVMQEIFSLTEAALRAGQPAVDVHVFPFRMTEAALARHAASEWTPFWRNLKEGYDSFERTRLPPLVFVCDRRYHIRDAGPGEVADNGPLAPCGGATAAPLHLALSQPLEPARWRWRPGMRRLTKSQIHNSTAQFRRSRQQPTATLKPEQVLPAPRAALASGSSVPLPNVRVIRNEHGAGPTARQEGSARTAMRRGVAAARERRAKSGRETRCRNTRRPCVASLLRREAGKGEASRKGRQSRKSQRAGSPSRSQVAARRATRVAGAR